MDIAEAMRILNSAVEEANYGTHRQPDNEELSSKVAFVQQNYAYGLDATCTYDVRIRELAEVDEALSVLGYGPVINR